jgi:hypothetical protein
MAEVNQYSISHKELIELIIKSIPIHEGRWTLMVNFGMAPASIGPSPDAVVPAMMIGVQNVGIQREIPGSAPGLVVDAAEINPKPKKKD